MMLKLVSDPTQKPIREVSLMEGTTGPNFYVNPQFSIRDKIQNALDASRIRSAKVPRRDLTLVVDYLTWDDYQQLLMIADEGHSIYVLPNFDKTTILNAPLNASTYAWVRDKATGLLTKDAGTFTPGTTYRNYTDDHGDLVYTDSNGARFMPSAHGRGLVLDPNREYVLAKNHPESGTLLWSSSTGSPSLSWYTEATSSWRSAGGVLRVEDSGAGSIKIDYDTGVPAATLEWYVGLVRLKGQGRVTFKIENGASQMSSTVDLTSEETELVVAIHKDTTDQYVTLTLSYTDESFDTVMLIGPTALIEMAAGNDDHGFPEWHYADVTVADEEIKYTAEVLEHDLTLAVCGLMPGYPDATFQEVPLITTDGTNDVIKLWFNSSGQVLFRVAGTDHTVSISPVSANEPFALSAVWKPRYSGSSDTERGVRVRLTRPGRSDITKDVSAPAQAFSFNHDTIYVGCDTSTSTKSCRSRPQHVRVDGRAWSVAEQQLWASLMLEDQYKEVISLTQGREYALGGIPLAQRVGNWAQLVGPIPLIELGRDPNMILV